MVETPSRRARRRRSPCPSTRAMRSLLKGVPSLCRNRMLRALWHRALPKLLGPWRPLGRPLGHGRHGAVFAVDHAGQSAAVKLLLSAGSEGVTSLEHELRIQQIFARHALAWEPLRFRRRVRDDYA